MKAVAIILGLTLSTIASAAYKCDLNLEKNGTLVASKSVITNYGSMEAGHFGDLYIEIAPIKEDAKKSSANKKSKKKSEPQSPIYKYIVIHGIMNGWDNNEDGSGQTAIISLQRRHYMEQEERNISLEGDKEILVEKLSLKGAASEVVEFEDYKLSVSCDHAEDEYNH